MGFWRIWVSSTEIHKSYQIIWKTYQIGILTSIYGCQILGPTPTVFLKRVQTRVFWLRFWKDFDGFEYRLLKSISRIKSYQIGILTSLCSCQILGPTRWSSLNAYKRAIFNWGFERFLRIWVSSIEIHKSYQIIWKMYQIVWKTY